MQTVGSVIYVLFNFSLSRHFCSTPFWKNVVPAALQQHHTSLVRNAYQTQCGGGPGVLKLSIFNLLGIGFGFDGLSVF